jgi:hypothetical protein
MEEPLCRLIGLVDIGQESPTTEETRARAATEALLMLHSSSRIFPLASAGVARSQHPRDDQDLLDRIHKVTEKPVK